MKALHKEARDLRFKNMQEFESILNDKQKKTLEKMKKEGRKKFQKEHKNHPNFGHERDNNTPKCNCGCQEKTSNYTKNDTSIIKNLEFKVLASDGTVRRIPSTFSSIHNAWVGQAIYGISSRIPVNHVAPDII